MLCIHHGNAVEGLHCSQLQFSLVVGSRCLQSALQQVEIMLYLRGLRSGDRLSQLRIFHLFTWKALWLLLNNEKLPSLFKCICLNLLLHTSAFICAFVSSDFINKCQCVTSIGSFRAETHQTDSRPLVMSSFAICPAQLALIGPPVSGFSACWIGIGGRPIDDRQHSDWLVILRNRSQEHAIYQFLIRRSLD